MTKPSSEVSVLRDFEEFYSEIVWLRDRVESQSSGQPEDAENAADPTMAVWSRLAELLERQARFTNNSAGDIGFGLYRECQYVMAALADEVFLNAAWSGRELWARHLLES